jgi:aspartate aminotransferase
VTEPGEEIMVFAPYFSEYVAYINGAGAKIRVVPIKADDFQINFEAADAIFNEKTAAVLINTPNNPSGAVYSEETICRLSQILKERSARYGQPIYLITDEPYREIAFSGITVPFVPKYYPNTLVCYSWSKSLSLPGERMGYILVAEEMEEHDVVYAAVAGASRALGYVSAPSLFQRVCALCAEDTSDVSVYETNRNILVRGLREIGFSVVEPQGTFYMFPRTLIEDDVAFCEKAREFDLLIVPGSGFGCPGHTRISYCVPTERAERSLAAFEKLAAYYLKNSLGNCETLLKLIDNS